MVQKLRIKLSEHLPLKWRKDVVHIYWDANCVLEPAGAVLALPRNGSQTWVYKFDCHDPLAALYRHIRSAWIWE